MDPEQEHITPKKHIVQKLKNYINGQMVAPVAGQYIDNYNPATGAVYALIPDSDAQDVELAVQAAQAAFPAWAATPAEKRGQLLMRIADLIDQHHNLLAEAESVDNGKPLKLAKTVDIPRASSNTGAGAAGYHL